MELPKPRLHKLAEDAISELAKDGVVCTPDDILWLQDAADHAIRPTRADEIAFLDMPVRCGDVLLWPLSIGARIWLKNYGRPWFDHTGQEQIILAYCMAHSRHPEVFQSLTSQFKTNYRVFKWASFIRASKRELNEAVAHCITPEDYDMVDVSGPTPSERPEHASDYGDCIALLCNFYGESPSHWLWNVGESVAAGMLNKISRIMPADKKIDSGNAKFTSLSEFLLVKSFIRKSHKEKKETV